MSSKFKIQYYHKIPQSTSPYLQLLEAKKKIFGYKYEVIRNDKSTSQTHNKSISQTSNPQPSHKHSKTQSHEKEKPKSQKQNSRKKRSQTEQAEQRMHESLFLNRDVERSQSKEGKHQATKSLFTVQGQDQSINPHDFLKNYKNLLENEDKNIKSYTQQVESKGFSKQRNTTHAAINGLQKLQIGQIDDLINLIDGCIEQSNDYISYLTEKIEVLKGDMDGLRDEQLKLVKMKDGIINEKDHEIDRLKKELLALQYVKPESEKTFEIKKLLQIIDKMTEENKGLRQRLDQLIPSDKKNLKEHFQREKKDMYNEIHNKIDILNISIDKKNQEQQQIDPPEYLKDAKKSKYGKPKFYK